jgi:hypothetical protein
MSRRIQDLFGSDIEMLYYETVAFHICFFRSPHWADIPLPTRKKMKQSCSPIIKEITEMFRPKRILVIGFITCRYLERILGGFTGKRTFCRKGGQRLIEESKWGSEWGTIPIFVVAHLTGAQLSNEERRVIQDSFHEWVWRKPDAVSVPTRDVLLERERPRDY